ncbi:hypothetical protein Q6348_13255 [Isoptericola sp. b441]|uniref:ATPase n=1 Tax=Actinotalea lenta TaxID=3064654 RepID=A0ABT9DEX0_9CELL|nr:hypothetical protein [Isoptericola sp. b441]MDO8108163.1 hypothetical protein [Isoptericola sp. b441]
MSGRGLTAVLDELEAVVHAARAMPMSSSVLVAREEVIELVERARALLPEQLAHADEVLAGADRVLAEAHQHADRIVSSAQERAEDLVAHERIVLEAQARAEEIVAQARRTAAGLRRDADDYCDRRLADFEIDLGRVMAQVQAGRAKLADRLEHSATDDDPAGP